MALTTNNPKTYTPRSLGEGNQLKNEELLATKLVSLPSTVSLSQPVETLSGVGKTTARSAHSLGVRTFADLLEYLPFRYDDYRTLNTLANLAVGKEATVLVEIKDVSVRATRRRNLKLLECKVADQSSTVTAIWFNQAYLADQLKPGRKLRIHGQLDRSSKGVTFKVKSHELLTTNSDKDTEAIHTSGLVPVYPATEGLQARRIRHLVAQVQRSNAQVLDCLPAAIRANNNLPTRSDALAAIHFPNTFADAARARQRLAFEELFLLRLAIGKRRNAHRLERGVQIQEQGELTQRWLADLPFTLTADQTKAIKTLDQQLRLGGPLQSLLMGEVGSGKTVVALYTMLRAVESGGQAALMAPTETLADQHFRVLDQLTGGLEQIALLTSSTAVARRRELLTALKNGSLNLLVGTHALIQEDVEFCDLRVAVVDEQHRFGVEQRAALDNKRGDSSKPHVLHMTATPIPRTLALTAYGELNSLTLKQLPKGRRQVKTWSVPEDKRAAAYEFIRERLKAGQQCFVVCPLVEESTTLEAKAATAEAKRLAKGEFEKFQVGVIHGQMSARDKKRAMSEFANGKTNVLVATSVIEVGIDVPNASVMVVEEAERYGLSQLHQLRGRVGRGQHESCCLVFAAPRSEQAQRRIETVISTNDGFKLAEVDLELRGEGEILGKRQSGLPDLKAAQLPRDLELLVEAKEQADRLLERDPELETPQGWILGNAIEQRFYLGDTGVIPA